MTYAVNTDAMGGVVGSDTDLSVGTSRKHSDTPSRALRLVGRVLLWACIALVIVRGLGAIVSTPSRAVTRPGGATLPSPEEDVFAERFAEAYLSFTPGQSAAHRRTVGMFLAHGLSDQTAISSSGPGVSVTQAMVAREVSLGSSRAIITVAAVLNNGQTRYLAVPVAKGVHGGLDVFALPALVAPPAAGTASAIGTSPVPAADADAVSDLVRGFLAAYVSGQQGSSLSRWLAPRTVLAAMPPGLSLESTGSIGVVARSAGRLVVQADANVADGASGAVYQLAYRLTLANGRSGWRVAALAGGPRA